MARSYSIVDMRARCRETADIEAGTYFVDDTELDALINQAISDLYDLILENQGHDNYIKRLAGDTTDNVTGLTTVAGNPVVGISNLVQGSVTVSDFYLIRGIDIEVGGQVRTLEPFQFAKRNLYGGLTGAAVSSGGASGHTGVPEAYLMQSSGVLSATGQNTTVLRLFPTPDGAYPIQIWYVPHAPVLVAAPISGTNTSETAYWDGFNGWEEFVFVTVAAKVMNKQQRDPGPFMMRREQLINRIRAKANRDLSTMAGEVQDVYGLDCDDVELQALWSTRRP